MENTEKLILDLYTSILPYGRLDMEHLANFLENSEIEIDDFSEYLESYCEETESNLIETDLNYVAYEYLLQQARNEIEELTGKDIVNDTTKQDLYVYGNYIDTQYDFSDETTEEIKEWLKDINKESMSKQLIAFLEYINIEL